MPAATEPIEMVYCEHCHLATPIWRNRCIHCRATLSPNLKRRARTHLLDKEELGERTYRGREADVLDEVA